MRLCLKKQIKKPTFLDDFTYLDGSVGIMSHCLLISVSRTLVKDSAEGSNFKPWEEKVRRVGGSGSIDHQAVRRGSHTDLGHGLGRCGLWMSCLCLTHTCTKSAGLQDPG